MTTLAHVPLQQIGTHPSNPRFDAVADDDMVASVEAQGILTPVTLAPALAGEGFVLIGGHRRLDAATKAGLTQLPAIIREDLVTEAQQVEAMLVENLHRVDLTPVEEAQAYEQLTLFGMQVADIASATGRAVSTVKARLKLNSLPAAAKAKVHAGDATLLDAEALLEFTDNAEVLADLEKELGSSNYAWKLRHARDNAARAARNAKELAEFLASGAVRVAKEYWENHSRTGKQWPLYSFTELHLQQREAHPGCLGVVVMEEYQFNPHTLVCTNPASHPVDDTVETTTEAAPAAWVENEKAHEERLAAAAAREAAAKVRVEWLTNHYAAALPAAAKAKPLVAALRAALPPVLMLNDEFLPWTNLGPALGVDDPAVGWHDRTQQVTGAATELTVAKPETVVQALAAVLAVLTNEALVTDWTDDVVLADGQVDLWEWLTGAGYALSDADKEIAAAVAETRGRLAGDTDEEAS